MRFKASIHNISTFNKLIASLALLGKDVWLQLNNEQLRFTVVPEQGSQVWAVIAIERIFETYTIQSAAENNTINLHVPLASLQRALRSALSASSASIRLTKKDNQPLLSLTIITNNLTTSRNGGFNQIPTSSHRDDTHHHPEPNPEESFGEPNAAAGRFAHDRETTITQDIPVIVLAAATVDSIHEPRCPEPDVHIMMPPLQQLKSISERFTKLALSTSSSSSSSSLQAATNNNNNNHRAGGRLADAPSSGSRLVISANMHGVLKIGVETSAARIESQWRGLVNPDLDPGQVSGGVEGVREHASTRMREREGKEGWSCVRVEGRDWGRVLGVGRLGGRVVACFCNDHALILYVYLEGEEDSVLTYYISSYSS